MVVVDRPPGSGRTRDVPVVPTAEMTVVQAIRRCRQEAEDAKKERIEQSRINRDVYLGRQDWSYKMEGQSAEMIPKIPVAVEQMCSFVKRALVQFGDWFSIELGQGIKGPIDGAQLREVLKSFLSDLWDRNNKSQEFPTVISDGLKVGLLESLIILKIHGGMFKLRRPKFKAGSYATKDVDELEWTEEEVWRLRIDLIRPEDYFPDPTGNGLYEIHRCERDLHEVIEAAEDGLYDIEVVKELIGTSMSQPLDEKRTDKDRNQQEANTPSFRKKVVIEEFWGTLLNSDGTVAHRNVLAAVANDRYLIRKPEPNPFWHQESPFVAFPLIRVPFSVWHKALYDHGSSLSQTINELFSLMIDGAIAAVWGIKQLRTEDMEDPSQAADGIKQGMTIAVKNTLPHNADVLKQVSTGQVPNDAMAMLEMLGRELSQALLTNELKLGQLPPKQVLATEVVEASQSQAVTLDGIIADMETALRAVTRKAWLNILQNADDIPENIWTATINPRTAVMFLRASPEERYEAFADKCQFRVFGLSQTMQRALDFQKMMALMQAAMSNPILLRAFVQKYSGDKILTALMKTLNLNPDNLQLSEEDGDGQTAMEQIMMLTQMLGGGKGGGKGPTGGSSKSGAPAAGGASMPAQINQMQSPVTGLPANA